MTEEEFSERLMYCHRTEGMCKVCDRCKLYLQKQAKQEVFDDLYKEIKKLKKFTDVVYMAKIYVELKKKHLEEQE